MNKIICKKYCPYFKEEKEEIGNCFPVKLLNNIEDFTTYPEYRPFRNTFKILKDIYCKNCDFYPFDCDFNNGANGLPCGGYIFTEILLSEGLIDIEWLKEISEAIF